jgi:hypothetical protein
VNDEMNGMWKEAVVVGQGRSGFTASNRGGTLS